MKLERGEFLGDTLGSKQLPGLHMQLRQYSAGRTLPLHSHRSAYLCLTRAGVYDEHYSFRTRVCQPGTLSFHPAGEEHYQQVGAEPVLLMNVEVDSRWTDRAMFKEPWSVTDGPLVSLANDLYEEFQRPDDLTPLAIEALLLEMAVLQGRSERNLRPKWLSRATDIMHESFNSALKMQELAKEIGVHPAHFSRAFRCHFALPGPAARLSPSRSEISPSRMCSVRMKEWLRRRASFRAKTRTLRARSVNRSNVARV